ncbi:MAG: hypothetical protein QM767_15405 [Anaeromyxobacter sp.]
MRRMYVALRLYDADVASAIGTRPTYDIGGLLVVLELREGAFGEPRPVVVRTIDIGLGASELAVLPARDGMRDLVAVAATEDGLLWIYDDESGAMVKVFGRDPTTGGPVLGHLPFGLAVQDRGDVARIFVGFLRGRLRHAGGCAPGRPGLGRRGARRGRSVQTPAHREQSPVKALPLAALALALTACQNYTTSIGVGLNEPTSVAIFEGFTTKNAALHPYVAVASSGKDELVLIDALDDKAVLAPVLVRPQSVPVGDPYPAKVIGASLGDSTDEAPLADLLVVVGAGSTRMQLVQTWLTAEGAPYNVVADESHDVELGAPLVAAVAAPVPESDGAGGWRAATGRVRVIASLAGQKLAVAEYQRVGDGSIVPVSADRDGAAADARRRVVPGALAGREHLRRHAPLRGHRGPHPHRLRGRAGRGRLRRDRHPGRLDLARARHARPHAPGGRHAALGAQAGLGGQQPQPGPPGSRSLRDQRGWEHEAGGPGLRGPLRGLLRAVADHQLRHRGDRPGHRHAPGGRLRRGPVPGAHPAAGPAHRPDRCHRPGRGGHGRRVRRPVPQDRAQHRRAHHHRVAGGAQRRRPGLLRGPVALGRPVRHLDPQQHLHPHRHRLAGHR